MLRWCPAILLFASVLGACGDPVRDAAVEALGPEDPAVPPGPLHRPGQPCLLCHTTGGAAQRRYSVAGTVFRDRDSTTPLADADVYLVDARGRQAQARTNCVGNFYLRPSQFAPAYPLWATLRFAGQTIDMESPIHAEGSCAACHADPRSPAATGHVYLTDDPGDKPTTTPAPCGGAR